MARLIDDIRAAGGLAMPPFILPERRSAWQALAGQVYSLLDDPGLLVLVIDNTSRFLYTDSGQEVWSLERDFPNLTPPFPLFWCEHAIPEKIHSRELGDTDTTQWARGGRLGVLIHGLDRSQVDGGDIPPSVRWILWCEIFLDCGDGAVQGPHGSIFVAVDAAGRIVKNPWMQSFAPASDADVMKAFMSCLHPVFLAMQYLHFNPEMRATAEANCGAEL